MQGGRETQRGPRSVEEVFSDYRGRRVAVVKALTTGEDASLAETDEKKENLCLYGFPNEQWEVNPPAEEVPPKLPEPVLGINFARDGMKEKDWLCLIAVHGDAWLISVAYFFGVRFGFGVADRKRLFDMINGLPTVFDVVNGSTKKKLREKSSVSNRSSKRIASAPLLGPEYQGKYTKAMQLKDKDEGYGEEDEDKHWDAFCGECGKIDSADEFWICCDICEKWFHGKCVEITLAKAENIKHYKCPSCRNKRVRF